MVSDVNTLKYKESLVIQFCFHSEAIHNDYTYVKFLQCIEKYCTNQLYRPGLLL